MFNNSGSRFGSIPPVTKNLIIINVLVWVVAMIFPSFANNALLPHLGLHYVASDLFNPVQIFTYMFLHSTDSVFHLFFNMFSLWMFGRILEQVWGAKRYLLFYMVCGVGAALVQEALWALTWQHDYVTDMAKLNLVTYDHMSQAINQAIANGDGRLLANMMQFKNSIMTIGASGAIFGLLLGFAFVFPNLPLYIFFIPIPIKAKYMVIGYAILEFYFGVSRSMDTVAHFAHLGGMLFGLILLLYWRKKGILRGDGFY